VLTKKTIARSLATYEYYTELFMECASLCTPYQPDNPLSFANTRAPFNISGDCSVQESWVMWRSLLLSHSNSLPLCARPVESSPRISTLDPAAEDQAGQVGHVIHHKVIIDFVMCACNE